MSKSKSSHEKVQKEDVLQAVLVADDFNNVFDSYVEPNASVLLPVVNCPILDYSLECLGRCGIQETILFCSSNADVIKEHLRKSKWSQPYSTMVVTVIVSEKCQSLGDAMRDLDNKSLIKGDFILISAFTVSNLKLMDILDYHRNVCKKDKGAAMTLVLQSIGSSSPSACETVVAVNALSSRLLHYVKPGSSKKIQLPLEYLLEHQNLKILSHTVDTGISVCSPVVPMLFSDNFDFQTKEDFIRGLLLNEEVLASRIYCWQCVGSGYGQTISDWRTYQRVSHDVIHRYTFPLVPDQPVRFDEEPFVHCRNGVYKQPAVQLGRDCDLGMDVVLGTGTTLGNHVSITRSVIGRNCHIGDQVSLVDSYIMDNVVVGSKSNLKLCVVGHASKIKDECVLQNCVMKKGVELSKGTKKQDSFIMSAVAGKRPGEKLSGKAFVYPMKADGCDGKNHSESAEEEDGGWDDEATLGYGLVDPESVWEKKEWDNESETSEDSDMRSASPPLDDTKVFYCEVLDSIQRGYEEKLSCDNLILEINSSRYAYNVTLSDVTTLTVRAILALNTRLAAPASVTVKSLLVYFLPLLENYIKTPQAQAECLDAVEEMHEDIGQELAGCLHYLYDKDILGEEAILEWHENLTMNNPLRKKVAKFVQWLNDADEESS